MHEGHRKRKKEWVAEHGFDSFQPHELLEFMLYYAIPRSNTNEIAHNLIERFGGISGVVEASVEELCDVNGIGFSAALYLKMFPSVMRMCNIEKAGKNISVNNSESLEKYLVSLFDGKVGEHFYCISVSNSNRVAATRLIASGTIDNVNIPLANLVKIVIGVHASSIIIAHNHPYGSFAFSHADCLYTEKVMETLQVLGVKFIDHYLVVGNKCLSYLHGTI